MDKRGRQTGALGCSFSIRNALTFSKVQHRLHRHIWCLEIGGVISYISIPGCSISYTGERPRDLLSTKANVLGRTTQLDIYTQPFRPVLLGLSARKECEVSIEVLERISFEFCLELVLHSSFMKTWRGSFGQLL